MRSKKMMPPRSLLDVRFDLVFRRSVTLLAQNGKHMLSCWLQIPMVTWTCMSINQRTT